MSVWQLFRRPWIWRTREGPTSKPALRESSRESSREPESSASPVYISADEAEFLNGEKIEVLADVHAEQMAEI